MNSFLRLFPILPVGLTTIALLLGGCASSTPTRTGFLNSYDGLSPQTGKTHALVSAVAGPILRDNLLVAPVIMKANLTKAGISPDQATLLCAAAQTELTRALVAAAANPGATANTTHLELRSAITRVDTSNPALNVVTAAAFFVPFDNGGICLEWELVELPSGRQIARGINNATGKPWQVKAYYQKTGHATRGLKDIADDIAHTLGVRANIERPASNIEL